MSTRNTYVCDRCRKETTGYLSTLRWATRVYMYEWNCEKDLCEVCKEDFRKFMKEKQ